MNMKMKMKNNKTMLALVLVAALALCGFAVAANADDSSAASESFDVNGSATIPASATTVFVYESATDAWESTLTIASDVTFNGTVSYGYRTGEGTVDEPYVYVAVGSMTLKDVSDLTIDIDIDIVTAGTFNGFVISGTNSGDIELTKGTLKVDGTATQAYTGKIIAADLTVDLVNTYGVVVTYGDVATVSGGIYAGVEPKSWVAADGAYSTATIGGTGYFGNFQIATVENDTNVTKAVELIIADGATISNDVSKVYGSIVVTVNAAATTDVAALIGVDGTVITGSAATTGAITFANVNLSQSYSAMITFTNSNSVNLGIHSQVC